MGAALCGRGDIEMALTNPKYNALPQLANIQGFWRLEETSGTRYDETDNNNDLTPNTTIGYGTGKIGNAVDLEASSSNRLVISDAAQTGLDITGNMSASVWIKGESISSSNTIFSKFKLITNGYSYMLRLYNGKINGLLSGDGDNSTQITGGTTLSTGTFYHIFFIYDGSKVYLYLNNSSDATPVSYSSGIYNSSIDFSVGCYFSDAGTGVGFFDGLVDELIIWNTALTEAERTRVYKITEESMYKKASGGILNWWFFKEAWEKHDRIWTPKLTLPKDLGFSY